MSALTREDFQEGVKRILEDTSLGSAPLRYVSGVAWSRYEAFKSNPRLSHHDDVLLLAYAEIGATPPLLTASYALGKSYRRRARRSSK